MIRKKNMTKNHKGTKMEVAKKKKKHMKQKTKKIKWKSRKTRNN